MIRVLIADDHNLVREGIRLILERDSEIEVIAEVDSGLLAFRLAERLDPDVMILDIAMQNLNGLQVVEKVTSSGLRARCIILSMYSRTALVRQAFTNGAKGYVLKNSVKEELLLAVRAAHKGDIFVSPQITNILLKPTPKDAPQGASVELESLTARELEVLTLIAEGLTNKDISELLSISVKTVEKHRSNLMSKLSVNDVVGLIRVALKNNLIILED